MIRAGLLLLASLLFAQGDAPIRWKIAAVAPGPTLKVKLVAGIAPGWHLYSLKKLAGGPVATTITVPDGQLFQLAGKIEAPEPIALHDPNFDMEVEYYADSAEFVVPVKKAPHAKPGRQTLTIAARFQSCNDKICLPPRTVKLETQVD
jgi:DsbC/DsbD-like thiol-disulfide interchange protein